MDAFIVLAGVGSIAISAVVIFTILVIGIRRIDRRHLRSAPESNSEAFARSLILSVRYPDSSPESANHEAEDSE